MMTTELTELNNKKKFPPACDCVTESNFFLFGLKCPTVAGLQLCPEVPSIAIIIVLLNF